MFRKVIHNAYNFVIFQESPTPMKPSQVRYINVKSFCPLVNEYDINDAKMMQYTCNVPFKSNFGSILQLSCRCFFFLNNPLNR
jgi:hypothetical protein